MNGELQMNEAALKFMFRMIDAILTMRTYINDHCDELGFEWDEQEFAPLVDGLMMESGVFEDRGN